MSSNIPRNSFVIKVPFDEIPKKQMDYVRKQLMNKIYNKPYNEWTEDDKKFFKENSRLYNSNDMYWGNYDI